MMFVLVTSAAAIYFAWNSSSSPSLTCQNRTTITVIAQNGADPTAMKFVMEESMRSVFYVLLIADGDKAEGCDCCGDMPPRRSVTPAREAVPSDVFYIGNAIARFAVHMQLTPMKNIHKYLLYVLPHPDRYGGESKYFDGS